MRIRTSPCPDGRKDERGLRECHLRGDPLHQGRRNVRRVGEDRELVALEAVRGKDVEVEIAQCVELHGYGVA